MHVSGFSGRKDGEENFDDEQKQKIILIASL